ncbi:tetratricopeptide repeat protein [Streptomyces sp. N35]|uniref:tetratricopeptide repeat protein n=1 Tax=Streptomyces sp. N35 TaxID=2795730 RepID=UPI0018F3750C|nr:tetratricopeptide repeat protein [Streptomyces sp. N35]
MEFDRRVQIWVRRPGTEKESFGSGYLIAPRLVLTAAHVLNGMDTSAKGTPTEAAVQVCLPDTSEQQFGASVVWKREDVVVDAALLEVADGQGWHVPPSLTDLITRPPQRYGLLIGPRAHPVIATGFPRLQRDPADGRRLDEQLADARIVPGTGSLAGRYEITSTTPTPATDTKSRWAGMSGAAVLAEDGFGGDLLCGVIRRDRLPDGGTRLTATTAAWLLADPEFRDLITRHTGIDERSEDVAIAEGGWEPVLEPIEPAALLTPATVDRVFGSPARLLSADVEAVAFHGRETELADLQRWCEARSTPSGPDVAIRVMTGPGGQGKTRLARRLCDFLGWAGWVTGHLRSDLADTPALAGTPPDFTALNTNLPLLLVVDYAETRPQLLRNLITHVRRSRHRVRLLLIARSDGGWRTEAAHTIPAVRDLLTAAPVVPLPPLIPTSKSPHDRRSSFNRAVRDLARLLPQISTLPAHDWNRLAGTLHPPADLSHARYDNVLTLQLTALVSLLQQGPRPVDAAPNTPPEEILLQHEERFWEDSAQTATYKLGLPVPTLAAAVALAALCGAATANDAVKVTSTLPALPSHQATTAAAWLASLYPGDPDSYWGTLQPDRIAEYHASHVLKDGAIKLPDLLAAGTPTQQAQTVTVLARAAMAHYNAGRTTRSEQLLATLDAALDAASLDHQALQTATDSLPHPSRITGSLAVRLNTELVRADQRLVAAKGAAHEPELARSLFNLGHHLSESGLRAEALTATVEAVEIYRRLADGNALAYELDLAQSLHSLGVFLSEVGRHAEAVTAIGQAVKIYRRRVADGAVIYAPGLAASLTDLSVDLYEVGRRAEALATGWQAVMIRRRLATVSAAVAAAYEPDLAIALSNLGKWLWADGQTAEALATEQEALEIRRRLADGNAAAYEPHLARSLSNLAGYLSEVGRREEALAAAEEAVKIFRRLADSNVAAYGPDFARSLSNLGHHRLRSGLPAEALAAAEEEVKIFRRLADDNAAAYEPDLARSLSNLGHHRLRSGLPAEALAAAEEEVKIFRRLADDNAAAHEPYFARSLHNLGVHLSEMGRQADAVTADQQAVEIYRRLADGNAATFAADLADSLTNLGNGLSGIGRREEALTASAQAVENYRRLASGNPAAYESLARSLSNLAHRLSETGRQQEALDATEEAVSLYRAHLAEIPTLGPPLHATLGLQADVLGRLGRAEEAEAVRRWLMEYPPRPDPHQ